MVEHRLRAPATDGALLAEPSLAGAARALAENAARLARWRHDFQGLSADRLRTMARSQVLDCARSYLREHGANVPGPKPGEPVDRLVVTGHQPELYHPGVWVKSFAAASIARGPGAVGLNLIVDNDILKSPGIRVPRETGSSFRVERVEFDEWRGEVPYEDLTVADEATFASFAHRVRDRLPATIADPMLDLFWPGALAAREVTDRLGYRFAMARHRVEELWGVHNLEVPVSRLCGTDAFLWFVCHVLAHLPRFQSVHNEALDDYRAVYGIRSRHHPVPDLGQQGEWLEAPFWVWREGKPRRRSLLARQVSPRRMELRIGGEDEPLMEISLGPDRDACCAVERLRTLSSRGVRLRTRALTTTMFARLLLGDLFLHGIGGAKYDELGDAIIQGFFEAEPPVYMTLTMTLWLGLEGDREAPARLAQVRRELRDIDWKPELWLAGVSDPFVSSCVAAKRAAIATPVASHAERRRRYTVIRDCNELLRPHAESSRDALRHQQARLLDAAKRDAVARNREFSMVLHSQTRLREAFTRAIPALAAEGAG